MEYNPYLDRKPLDKSTQQGGTGFIEAPQDAFMNLVWQTRDGVPDDYEIGLSEVLAELFASGCDELDAIVAGLEASKIRPPGRDHWDEKVFLSEMTRLGK